MRYSLLLLALYSTSLFACAFELRERMSDEALIEVAKQGDEIAESILIERYMPLVRKLALQFSSPICSSDDLINAGIHRLSKSIKAFDPVRTESFRMVVTLWLKQGMGEHVQRERKQNQRFTPFSNVNANSILYPEMIEAPDVGSGLEAAEAARVLREYLETLDEREQAIVKMTFGLAPYQRPMTTREISPILNFDHRYVNFLKQRAFDRLRKRLLQSDEAAIAVGIDPEILIEQRLSQAILDGTLSTAFDYPTNAWPTWLLNRNREQVLEQMKSILDELGPAGRETISRRIGFPDREPEPKFGIKSNSVQGRKRIFRLISENPSRYHLLVEPIQKP